MYVEWALTRGVNQTINFVGVKFVCPAKLSGALQTLKQTFVYRLLVKALPM